MGILALIIQMGLLIAWYVWPAITAVPSFIIFLPLISIGVFWLVAAVVIITVFLFG